MFAWGFALMRYWTGMVWAIWTIGSGVRWVACTDWIMGGLSVSVDQEQRERQVSPKINKYVASQNFQEPPIKVCPGAPLLRAPGLRLSVHTPIRTRGGSFTSAL